jgi:hypothetical protein
MTLLLAAAALALFAAYIYLAEVRPYDHGRAASRALDDEDRPR